MYDLFETSTYWGVLISLGTYIAGMMIRKKFGYVIFNPLLISISLTITFLLIFDIDYDTYESGAKYLSYMLTPATICLAVPLYEQFELLKKNHKAVLLGIISGSMSSLASILILSKIFKLDHKSYVTFLPKSITTAIGITVSDELGGYVPITVASIIITGIVGNVFADVVFKLFKIKEPIAKGVSLGTASHAMGTSKAMEYGTIEGAMASLSIVISGILTVFGADIFSLFN